MVKQTIQVFGRVKPTKAKKGEYEILDEEDAPLISFSIPKDLAHDFVNNKKEQYKFRFQKVFGESSKQDEIFENVAQPVIDNVLKGYNGTIFAYGQTGSGKTFTITGGAEKYSDRGIIPRTLSYIFDYYKQNPEYEYSTYISYLEIYNENGYDLLDPKHEAAKLEDLPKVSLLEDADQNIHLKNLSTHQASNEEEALNLLFLGDTNRMIAETPMNQASTRSHCVFTIHLTSREPGSATVRRSKLHLVDLAGSERVGKTGVNGLLLTEAKYINLSLHYLEQVIVALGEKTRSHIPYRNSMMTSVLRDSLGGNCMTTMIATLSVEKRNIDETISTCRFAQRVALIKNDAVLNEELDPKLMITKLKKEIQRLKDELAMATGEQRTDELTEEDLERCREAVERYLDDPDSDAVIQIGADMRKIHHCFSIMKQKLFQRGPNRLDVSSPSTVREDNLDGSEPAPDPGEIAKYKDLVQQRDNEINILVNMLKREKKRAADALSALEQQGHSLPKSNSTLSENVISTSSRLSNGATVTASYQGMSDRQPNERKWQSDQQKEKEENTKAKILGEMSMGRQEAFEIFRRDYHHNQAIEDNKSLLKQKYAEAKSLGETVNQARTKINKLKTSIEQHRMSRVMQGLVNPDEPEADEMELDMKEQMENEKKRYKETFTKLRGLKTEIEHLQHLLEQSKVKLMKDFELWWAEQMTSVQEQQLSSRGGSILQSKSAWRTPPITPNSQLVNSSQTSIKSGSTTGDQRPASRHRHGNQYYREARQPSLTSGYSSQESLTSSSSLMHTGSASSSGSISLTGDAKADADIMAFLKARQKLAKFVQKPR